MTIPVSPKFPDNFDDDDNLFLVHDSLRVRLAEDYTPGDTSITIEGDPLIMERFPPTGCITLTDQSSEIDLRAISFYYGSRTDTTFDELELLNDFVDTSKPKRQTNITMNVMASHHNHLKDALIAIEEFIGVKDTTDTKPFGETLEGRTNFLRKLVLTPRAWFSAESRIGVAPVEICFNDESQRNPTSWTWDFGDGSPTSTCSYEPLSTVMSASVSVPSGTVSAIDLDGKKICKTYYCPGKYDVTLTVSNSFGTDTITIPEYITVRAPAPDPATIVINPSKVVVNSLVNVEATDAGEQIGDPVIEYTWNLSDNLQHNSTAQTIASYSMGGFYDVKLRVDTELGAYRITVIEDAINVVERTNLWLLSFDTAKSDYSITKNASTYEFGLTSQTFKTTGTPALVVSRDHSFMSGYSEEEYQREIFRRNCGYAVRGTTASGDKGQALVFWAEDETTVRFRQFEPFNESWNTPSIGGSGSSIARNWNWTSFSSTNDLYLTFGVNTIEEQPADVNQGRHKVNLTNYSVSTGAFTLGNYANGAEELTTNPDSYPSTYRSALRSNNGFFARNDAGPGGFFRIKSFYKTSGVLNDLIQNVLKITDIHGSTRTECEVVNLQGGLYVFNNTGEVSSYDPTTNVWKSGGPGAGSASFSAYQDSTVSDYASISQPLRAASDNGRRAYLSFDYSSRAFIKFSEVDKTFTNLPARPTSNEQFMTIVY